jgi:arginyl-tRNA synthetase
VSLYEKIKDTIYQQLEEAAARAQNKGELNFDQLPPFVLEEPRERQHGDLATNLAMLLSKQARRAPRDIANIIIGNLNTEGTWINSCEIAGPGFINFRLDPNWLTGVIPEVISQGEKYGFVNIGQGEKVQVEFVSANPTGLLHMGNARGAALGDSLASLLAMAGYEVSREFYINDAGNQIHNFALSLEARYFQQLGHDVPFPEAGYHGEDLIETVKKIIEQHGDQYVQMQEELRREALVRYALAEKIADIKETLEDFGVYYDVWFSEQFLHDSGDIQKTTNKLDEKGYIYEKEGSLWLKSTLFGDEKDEVLVPATAYRRILLQISPITAINLNVDLTGYQYLGGGPSRTFARMKGAMQALGYNPENLQIILMQLVRLIQDGEIVRMSIRSRQYITLKELMSEVGKDAARFFFILRDPDSTVEFDLDLAKSQSADNPVYYVQYAHARLCSILRQAREQGYDPDINPENRHLKLLTSPEERDLLKKIADLPGEITLAARLTEPHRLARYVLDLAALFHTFYNSQRVLVDDEELRTGRLGLIRSTRQVLANVLKILGVSAPERM